MVPRRLALPYCHGWEVPDPALRFSPAVRCRCCGAAVPAVDARPDAVPAHGPEPTDGDWEQLAARGVAVVSGEVASLEVTEDRLTWVRRGPAPSHRGRRSWSRRRTSHAPNVMSSFGLEVTEHPMGIGSYVPADPNGQTAVPGVWVPRKRHQPDRPGRRRDGGTVFLSMHLLAEVAQVCDRVAVLNAGRLVARSDASVAREALDARRLRNRTAGDPRIPAVLMGLATVSVLTGAGQLQRPVGLRFERELPRWCAVGCFRGVGFCCLDQGEAGSGSSTRAWEQTTRCEDLLDVVGGAFAAAFGDDEHL